MYNFIKILKISQNSDFFRKKKYTSERVRSTRLNKKKLLECIQFVKKKVKFWLFIKVQTLYIWVRPIWCNFLNVSEVTKFDQKVEKKLKERKIVNIIQEFYVVLVILKKKWLKCKKQHIRSSAKFDQKIAKS